MEVSGTLRGGTLYVHLGGEIDEYSAAAARSSCDRLIEANACCDRIVFDLSGVKFMDSAGIGFLIGRYKKASRLQIPVNIASADFAADKILNLSGIYTIMPKTERG